MEVHFVMVSDLEVFISNYLAVWVAIGFMCKLPVYIFWKKTDKMSENKKFSPSFISLSCNQGAVRKVLYNGNNKLLKRFTFLLIFSF